MTTKANANATRDAAKVAGEALDAVVSASKETVEQVVEAGAKGYDEFATFGKGNLEAMVTAGNVASKGFEAIGAEMLAYTTSHVDDGIATTRAVMSAVTPMEIIELQAVFVETSLKSLLSATTKFGEMSRELTKEVFEPVNGRLVATAEKFIKPISI